MKPRKAVALMSGGLDSLLAAKIIQSQGIEVTGINFNIGFGCGVNTAKKAAAKAGVPLEIVDVIDDYQEVLLNPKHGYGSLLNPCMDCKIFMIGQAFEWMQQHDYDFIITGEVVGQRPKSQRADTIPVIAVESGANDLLLRPLCAKLLKPTLPEREGWVKRELLYGWSGRSRKPQIELVKKFGIEDYPQPAGGCLLTDTKFCDRLKDLWEHNGKKQQAREDLALLKVGRHLRCNPDTKIIIGRNESENDILEKYASHFTCLDTISHGGPITLITGNPQSQDINLAAQITARFSSGRDADQVTLQITSPAGKSEKLEVVPMLADAVLSEWYI